MHSLDRGTRTTPVSQGLASGLARFFGNASVNEFGAGMGCYTDALRSAGVRIRGFDGADHISDITRYLVSRADLTKRFQKGRRDWVLCMEVAEHIPKQFEETFLANIDAHNAKGVVLSWSPIVDGKGHVNPRPTSHVEHVLGKLGYVEDAAASKALQESVSTWTWFKPVENGDGGVRVYRRIPPPRSNVSPMSWLDWAATKFG